MNNSRIILISKTKNQRKTENKKVNDSIDENVLYDKKRTLLDRKKGQNDDDG